MAVATISAAQMDVVGEDTTEKKEGSGIKSTDHTHVYGNSRKGAKTFQEDSFFTYVTPDGLVTIGGVFDGHGGYNGLLAATGAKDYALKYFDKEKEKCSGWSKAEWTENLALLFTNMHLSIRDNFLNDRSNEVVQGVNRRYLDDKGIVRNASGDPVHGGSTGTVVAVVRNKDDTVTVICANVGDSAAVIIKDKKYEFLTVDHGPENADEFKRLQSLDDDAYPMKLLYVYDKATILRKYECPQVFLQSGVKDPKFVKNPWGNGLHPTNVRYEPAVYAVTPRAVSKDTTCIAMTRALGDLYAHQFGLSHEPSITIMDRKANEEILVVVASDGIWDCWRYEDFAEFIADRLAKSANITELVETALNESISRAIANFGAKNYDDASAVVIHLPKQDA